MNVHYQRITPWFEAPNGVPDASFPPMKNILSRTRVPRLRAVATAVTLAGIFANGGRALADTISYTGTGTSSWNTGTDWSSGTPAGAGDTAVFNNPVNTAAEIVTLDANQAALGIQVVATEGMVSIYSTATTPTGSYTLTLGTGGITNAGAGDFGLRANVVLNGTQSWSSSTGKIFQVYGAINGTGNLTVDRINANSDALGSVTGSLTVTGQSDFSSNLLNTFSNGVIVGTGTVGLQTTITDATTLKFTGSTNWYTNGFNQSYSASVTGGTMGTIGTGNLTFTGSTDNTGLSVVTPNGTASVQGLTSLGKTSGSSVHAIGGNLTIATYDTVQLTGTGGDQIIDTGNVSLAVGSIFDLNGNNETINNLTSAATGNGTVMNTASGTTGILSVGAGNGSGTFSGVLQNGLGTLGLTKVGTGTLTLTGPNTYTGNTTIRQGSLTLNFSATGAPTSNIISGASTLDLAGGTLATTGATTGTTTQGFNGAIIDPGASSVAINSNGGTSTVTLGGITRNAGGTIDFTLPASGTVSTTTANASFSGGQQTILGGYATVGGSTWAVSGSGATAGTISGLTSYSSTFASGTDVDVPTGTTTPGSLTVNSLRFNGTGAATAVNSSGNLVVATGGILTTSNVGAYANTINGGTITSCNGADLVIIQNNTNASGGMTVGSAIVDNGGTAIGLTKSGAGSLTLTGTNTYTGATQLNAGATTVANTSTLGSGSAVSMKGTSTLSFTNTGAQLNLQSIGATATASSNNQPAANAIDGTNGVGNTGTRWETASSDPQYLVIDLKGNYNIGSVKIGWETADAKAFQLQTAPSGTATTPNESGTGGTATNGWTTDYNTTNNPASGPGVGSPFNGYLTYNLTSGSSGEFLAMYGTSRNTGYGYSIWDVQVFTAAGALTQTIGSLASPDSTTGVTLASQLTLDAGSNNASTTFAGVISGSGNLSKSGTGTMTLTGANTYTGTTAVNGGTLSLARAGTISGTTITGGTLAATAVTVGSGGTLQVAANNAIAPASTLTLSGGTLSIGSGVLQGQGATLSGGIASGTNVAGLGALTLAANSTLSFAGASGTVVHGFFAPGTYTLNVTGTNFGTSTASADGATDRLIFAADESAYLGDFAFNGVAGASEVALGGGFYEVIPGMTAVPEPATWAAGLLCVGTLAYRVRRRLGVA